MHCIITVYVGYFSLSHKTIWEGTRKDLRFEKGQLKEDDVNLEREKAHKIPFRKRHTTKKCSNRMKDSQIPILLIRSFFYRGKAAYF